MRARQAVCHQGKWQPGRVLVHRPSWWPSLSRPSSVILRSHSGHTFLVPYLGQRATASLCGQQGQPRTTTPQVDMLSTSSVTALTSRTTTRAVVSHRADRDHRCPAPGNDGLVSGSPIGQCPSCAGLGAPKRAGWRGSL